MGLKLAWPNHGFKLKLWVITLFLVRLITLGRKAKWVSMWI